MWVKKLYHHELLEPRNRRISTLIIYFCGIPRIILLSENKQDCELLYSCELFGPIWYALFMLTKFIAFLCRPNYIEATLLGSLMYLSSLRGKVLNVSGDDTGKENICLLKRIIELISNAAMQLDIWYKSYSEEDTSDVSKCVDTLTSFLKELVADRRVIGGSMFGYTELKKADMEFHVSLFTYMYLCWRPV